MEFPEDIVSPPSSGCSTPEPTNISMKPMPTYAPNHRALQLATLHRVQATRRPKTAGSKTIPHRRTRSRMSESSQYGLEADTAKSQATEPDWLEFLDNDVFDYDAEDEPPPPDRYDREDPRQKLYRAACRSAKIPPASSVIRGLVGKAISIKHHIVGAEGARTIAIALTRNGTVEKLDLQDNSLGPIGTSHICEMLAEDIFITDLSLTENCLGTEGASLICKLLQENENIQKVDLSGNGFKEKDATMFVEMLKANYTLRELNLSHNEFRELGGEILSKGIAENTSLEVLDLSWNHLRNDGASAIGKSLTHNVGLKSLNLSWNGFHLMGCKSLGKALAVNHSLINLAMNNNRIDRECLGHLLAGLRKNTCLESIALNQNPIGTDGAIDILYAVQKAQNPALKEVDISSVTVDVEFKKLKRSLADSGRGLFILYGHTIHQDEGATVDAEGVFLNEDPMMVLMEYMRIKNLRLVDLFASMDKDGSGAITKVEFRDGLLKANVPLSASAIIRLVKKLDLNRDGEVDFSELMKGQKDHKRRVNRMKQMATERQWSFEQTEIGRVSLKLQALLNISAFKRSVRPVTSVSTALRGFKDLTRGGGGDSPAARAKTAMAMRTPGNTLTVDATDLTGNMYDFLSPGGSIAGSTANSRPPSASSTRSSSSVPRSGITKLTADIRQRNNGLRVPGQTAWGVTRLQLASELNN